MGVFGGNLCPQMCPQNGGFCPHFWCAENTSLFTAKIADNNLFLRRISVTFTAKYAENGNLYP